MDFLIISFVVAMLFMVGLVLNCQSCEATTRRKFNDWFGSPNSVTARRAFLDTFGVAWNAPTAALAVKHTLAEIPDGIDNTRECVLARGFGFCTSYWC